jgi:hypothetical protein
MLHSPVTRSQPFPRFRRLVVKRPHPAAIGDVPALINNVNALRPGGIGQIRRIAHIIHAERQRIFEALGKIIRNRHALLQRLRLRVTNVFLHVGFHLPFVGGVRFAHIYSQEISLILVVIINLYDVANLATEGGSGKTPKK